MINNSEIVGVLKKEIADLLNLKNNIVYIGEFNKEHIKSKHFEDYENYYQNISEIISNPDYFGINLKDDSIELVKEFETSDKVYVKVAVRISKKGVLFARTLYKLNSKKFEFQLSKGSYQKSN